MATIPDEGQQRLAQRAGDFQLSGDVYLDYLWQQRATLRVVHPWLVAAYAEFTKG